MTVYIGAYLASHFVHLDPMLLKSRHRLERQHSRGYLLMYAGVSVLMKLPLVVILTFSRTPAMSQETL